MNCKVKQCCAALAARKLAEHDPAVVETTRGGKNKSHHVLRKSDMKKIGLIAGGAFVALTALNVYSHYKVHQAIADRKVLSPRSDDRSKTSCCAPYYRPLHRHRTP